MAFRIDIDSGSGFCKGVIRAIDTAQASLQGGGVLYSIGAIVHNEKELERLQALGLRSISSDMIDTLPPSCKVLIRAHGEPPSTYDTIKKCGLELTDCTCPVVLKLQRDILHASCKGSLILIFGKKGHAEVLGLMGQAPERSRVIENAAQASEVPLEGGMHYELFSQTTKDPEEYSEVAKILSSRIEAAGSASTLSIHDTICSQVRTRHRKLREFAAGHDLIIFVSGKESSNGKVLYELCRSVNPHSYHVTCPEEIDRSSLSGLGEEASIGICGATSTPQWLLAQCAENLAVK